MCGSGGGTRVSGGGTSVSAGGLCRSAGGTCRSAEGTCGSGGGTRAYNSSASGATWGAVGAMAGTAKATAVSNPGRQEDGSGSTDCRGAEKMREGAENTWHKESEMPSRGGNNGGSEGEGGNEVLDAEEGWAKEEVDDDSLAVIRDEASVKFGDAAGECNPLRHKKVARSSSKGALQRSSSRRLVRQKSANVPSLKRSSTQKVVNVPSTPPNRTLRRSLTVGADVEPTGHIAPLFARGRRTDWGDDAEGKAAGEKMTGPQQRALRPAEKSYALVPTVEALEDLRKLLPLLAASLMLNRKEQLPEGHATHFVESFFFNKVKRAGGSAQWRRPVERIEELTRALKTGVQRGMSPSGQRGAGEEEQRPSFGGASNKDVSVYKRTHINYDLVRHLITGEEEAPLINEHDELPRNPGAGPSTTYLPRQGSSTSNLLSAHPVCPPKQLVAAVAYPCPTLPFARGASSTEPLTN
ncbi:hypothetical protein AB1Y20_022394 [Prymnesium parvum]|uniref:Uncharacterized protein n=1 Tax=Prymnesium parvum TaxID=97485 RepID=A0AB34JIV8_PRYPA